MFGLSIASDREVSAVQGLTDHTPAKLRHAHRLPPPHSRVIRSQRPTGNAAYSPLINGMGGRLIHGLGWVYAREAQSAGTSISSPSPAAAQP